MKKELKLLCLPLFLLFASKSFSQIADKKEMQKKTDSITKIQAMKTLVRPAGQVQTSVVNDKTKPVTMVSDVNNSAKFTKGAVSAAPKGPTTPPGPTTSQAALLDAFVTVSIGTSAQVFPVTSGENKDPDTHWSCGTFDQNGRPVTSFHDDSNTDEYAQGSVTGPLQMHIDNPAVFGDFANGGHLHINIAPNGNDTWGITNFTLAFDFQNPKISQKISWSGFELSQDKRDIDLYFVYDGKNLVVRK